MESNHVIQQKVMVKMDFLTVLRFLWPFQQVCLADDTFT